MNDDPCRFCSPSHTMKQIWIQIRKHLFSLRFFLSCTLVPISCDYLPVWEVTWRYPWGSWDCRTAAPAWLPGSLLLPARVGITSILCGIFLSLTFYLIITTFISTPVIKPVLSFLPIGNWHVAGQFWPIRIFMNWNIWRTTLLTQILIPRQVF